MEDLSNSKIHTAITKPNMMALVPETYLLIISFITLFFVAFNLLLFSVIVFLVLWILGAVLTYIDPYMIMVIITKFKNRPTRKYNNKKGQYYVG